MKIISKYIAKSLVKNICSVLFAVVIIYLAVDFFEKIDDFMEAKMPLSIAAYFFALRAPFVVAQVLPVGVLLSALLALGLMAKKNEIIAYASGGGSGLGLLKPVAAIGLCAGVLLFLFNDAVVPFASAKANRIWYGEIRGENNTANKKNIWFKRPGLVGRIGRYNPAKNTAGDITLNYFDHDFKLIKRIDAKKAVFSKGLWTLFDVMETHAKKTSRVVFYDKKSMALEFSADDMHDRVKRSDEMSYAGLLDHIKKIEAEGYDSTRFRVDLAAKASFPLVCLIMAVLGGAIALRGKRGQGLALNVVFGMILAFAYWVVHSLCLSMGYAGLYPPILAAWTANILFAALSAILVYENA